MKQFIEIIVIFKNIQINRFLYSLTEKQLKENEEKSDQLVRSYDISSDFCQTICFVKELNSRIDYRKRVFKHLERIQNQSSGPIGDSIEGNDQKSDTVSICVALKSIDLYLPIDRNWNQRIVGLVMIRLRVEDSLSWLSTLGGAYSSLGEYNINCAVKAGEISVSQLGLASISGDPNIIAKCGIYMAYSLCQQQRRRAVIQMIREILYPYISKIQNCDKIVKSMYSALCYRIKNFDTN